MPLNLRYSLAACGIYSRKPYFPKPPCFFSPCAEVCNDPSIAFAVPRIAPALNTQVNWRTP